MKKEIKIQVDSKVLNRLNRLKKDNENISDTINRMLKGLLSLNEITSSLIADINLHEPERENYKMQGNYENGVFSGINLDDDNGFLANEEWFKKLGKNYNGNKT